MRLSAEIVDLVRLHLRHDPRQVGALREVAVVQDQPRIFDVRVFIDVVDPLRIEERGAALDTVNLVTIFEKKFGEI